MRYIIRLLITCFVCLSQYPLSAQTAALDTTKRQFKVLSYNLRFGELASLEELAAYIKEHDPDLVALQEVDVRTQRGQAPHQRGKDFASELAFRTGMMPAFGKTIPFAGGYYGIAILSKYPLNLVEKIFLPMTSYGREQRAVLVADVEYEEGRFVTFASTHLDYTHTQERQEQVLALNEALAGRAHPIILGGDFNAEPEAPEIQEGMAAWMRVSDLKPTFPSSDPSSIIDYIFCYPSTAWNPVRAYTDSVQLSDHLPVWVIVELNQ